MTEARSLSAFVLTLSFAWGAALAVGRFQVMALLQAARAYTLGLSIYRAKSWGLNRAIFYAAAKRGFMERGVHLRRSDHDMREKPIEERRDTYYLGSEMAYKTTQGRRTYFTIGGQAQTDKDFAIQIESRFGGKLEAAWEEALRIVRQFDKETLLSQSGFYETVYKPRRDELAAKWTQLTSKT